MAWPSGARMGRRVGSPPRGIQFCPPNPPTMQSRPGQGKSDRLIHIPSGLGGRCLYPAWPPARRWGKGARPRRPCRAHLPAAGPGGQLPRAATALATASGAGRENPPGKKPAQIPTGHPEGSHAAKT
ncbi:hypothetical protein TNIN_464611 [Trichonephila inaurata madagascariensis]|uniref:Uncharacterized protein n=1 Tax=Trichonephila inaurata madagascariensis TaxID=2747483 RepID=A0A8X6YV07_9ARAC|nr:hypothetical protein TNIN_464611 [Trichonephila inaurata madagascariensis]